MELSIPERLKDLRVERGLTLEQLAEQTHLSKSALGSYEGDNFKDIYVTNQRACFQVRMIGKMDMNLPLLQIKGFSVKKTVLFTRVTIYSWTDESYTFRTCIHNLKRPSGRAFSRLAALKNLEIHKGFL